MKRPVQAVQCPGLFGIPTGKAGGRTGIASAPTISAAKSGQLDDGSAGRAWVVFTLTKSRNTNPANRV
jgi:hypothetical protein